MSTIKDKISSGEEMEKMVPEKSIISEPYEYIHALPGKEIRRKLLEAFNEWLDVEEDALNKVFEILDTLHHVSLLFDDIEDGSDLRRGQPSAHIVFGVSQTINSANYKYIEAFQLTMALGHPKAGEILTEEMSNLLIGQGMEIYWRDSFICPTEADFRNSIAKKTSALLQLGVRLLQLFSENKADFGNLVSNLGLYFQIHNDYATIKLTEYTDKKGFCDDVTEGKFSFPAIHAIRSVPEDEKILNILKMRTRDLDLKLQFVSLLEERGSIKYTERVLGKLAQEITEEIQSFGGNCSLMNIVNLFKI